MSGHPDAIDAGLCAVRRGGGMILFGLPKGGAVTFERYSQEHARDDVRDRGVEGGRAHANRAALDQDVLRSGLLEAGLEDLVHTTRLARSG